MIYHRTQAEGYKTLPKPPLAGGLLKANTECPFEPRVPRSSREVNIYIFFLFQTCIRINLCLIQSGVTPETGFMVFCTPILFDGLEARYLPGE